MSYSLPPIISHRNPLVKYRSSDRSLTYIRRGEPAKKKGGEGRRTRGSGRGQKFRNTLVFGDQRKRRRLDGQWTFSFVAHVPPYFRPLLLARFLLSSLLARSLLPVAGVFLACMVVGHCPWHDPCSLPRTAAPAGPTPRPDPPRPAPARRTPSPGHRRRASTGPPGRGIDRCYWHGPCLSKNRAM